MKQSDIDDKLGKTKFYPDMSSAHIEVSTTGNIAELEHLVAACPAGLYHLEQGQLSFSYEGCLECGTCRVLSGGKAIQKWNYPPDGFGVDYRQG